MEVTKLRDSIEDEKQNLICEQLKLTTQIASLQEQLDNTESVNISHEAKISEQQNRIDELLAQCKQVSVCCCYCCCCCCCCAWVNTSVLVIVVVVILFKLPLSERGLHSHGH